jgi:hypothetical protein
MAFFNSRTRLRVNLVLRNQLECWEGGVGGFSPGQFVLHDSATSMCSKTLITYINKVTVLVPDVQNSTAIVSERRGR